MYLYKIETISCLYSNSMKLVVKNKVVWHTNSLYGLRSEIIKKLLPDGYGFYHLFQAMNCIYRHIIDVTEIPVQSLYSPDDSIYESIEMSGKYEFYSPVVRCTSNSKVSHYKYIHLVHWDYIVEIAVILRESGVVPGNIDTTFLGRYHIVDLLYVLIHIHTLTSAMIIHTLGKEPWKHEDEQVVLRLRSCKFI